MTCKHPEYSNECPECIAPSCSVCESGMEQRFDGSFVCIDCGSEWATLDDERHTLRHGNALCVVDLDGMREWWEAWKVEGGTAVRVGRYETLCDARDAFSS